MVGVDEWCREFEFHGRCRYIDPVIVNVGGPCAGSVGGNQDQLCRVPDAAHILRVS